MSRPNDMSANVFEPLPTNRPPRESEARVLESWRAGDIFRQTLHRTAKGKPVR